MSLPVLLWAVALVTVGSRVAALALLPAPRGAAARLVSRLPAPLFAAMGALTLTSSAAGPTDRAMLAAVACALIASRWSSLLATLAAGITGFVVANLLW